MTSRSLPGYLFALFLLVYMSADLMDPSTPGIFFFENSAFFVDSVVQAKAHVAMPIASTAPLMPAVGVAADDDETAATRMCTPVRPFRPAHIRSTTLKHGDSASFASASPPDSPPPRS